MTAALTWTDKTFAELTPHQLYAILQLRQAVFVVEQKCAYLDADGCDAMARHLCGHDGVGLVAYARLVPAGIKHAEPSIGRVLIVERARGTGVGKALMRNAVARMGSLFAGAPIVLGAQAHLQRFYAEFGFEVFGEPYDEDGIPHINMRRDLPMSPESLSQKLPG
ncbi:MAG: GNAT family N-acetyltransferase [Kofleriaceae bacterium]|nr:GNAT family N-acetyltransferase [Kofleriaceae bacterium]